MSRAHSILRMVIATDVNGTGCNWNSRGWDQYEKQFMDTCCRMKRHGRGLIMRNCTRIECETVAARLCKDLLRLLFDQIALITICGKLVKMVDLVIVIKTLRRS